MPFGTFKEFTDFIVQSPWLAWAIWGGVTMAQAARKWKKFKFVWICLNLFVAWWVWVMVSWLLPEDSGNFWYFCISASWFLAYPLLDFLEDKWLDLFIKYLKRVAWIK